MTERDLQLQQSTQERSAITRRKVLGLGILALRGVALLGASCLGQATPTEAAKPQATAVAKAADSSPAATSPARPAPAVTQSPNVVPSGELVVDLDVLFPIPTEFRPEPNVVGKVDNWLLEQMPEGIWCHPVTVDESKFDMGDKRARDFDLMAIPENARKIWSYDWYYGWRGQGIEIAQHEGAEDEIYYRQNHDNQTSLVIAIGRYGPTFVDIRGISHDLTRNIRGGREVLFNVRTYPDIKVGLFRADDGQHIMTQKASEAGDIGFIVDRDFGRWSILVNTPSGVGFETNGKGGPHSRPELPLNIFDVRGTGGK